MRVATDTKLLCSLKSHTNMPCIFHVCRCLINAYMHENNTNKNQRMSKSYSEHNAPFQNFHDLLDVLSAP